MLKTITAAALVAVGIAAPIASAHTVDAEVGCDTVRVTYRSFPSWVPTNFTVRARSISDPLRGTLFSPPFSFEQPWAGPGVDTGLSASGERTIPFSPALVGEHRVEVRVDYASDVTSSQTFILSTPDCPKPPAPVPPSVPDVPPTAPEPPANPVPPVAPPVSEPRLPAKPDNPCPPKLVRLVKSGKAGKKWVKIAYARGCVKVPARPTRRCPKVSQVWQQRANGTWTCRRIVGLSEFPAVTG